MIVKDLIKQLQRFYSGADINLIERPCNHCQKPHLFFAVGRNDVDDRENCEHCGGELDPVSRLHEPKMPGLSTFTLETIVDKPATFVIDVNIPVNGVSEEFGRGDLASIEQQVLATQTENTEPCIDTSTIIETVIEAEPKPVEDNTQQPKSYAKAAAIIARRRMQELESPVDPFAQATLDVYQSHQTEPTMDDHRTALSFLNADNLSDISD